MDRLKRESTPGLAVEVAKLRLRVAAERAEPARMLRLQAAQAPLPTVATALLAGLMLGRRGADRGAFATGAVGTTLVSELLGLVSKAGAEWRR